MTSKELAIIMNCGHKYVSKITQKAKSKNQSFIIIKNQSFSFQTISTKYGKTYEYKKLESKTRATKISSLVVKNMEGLTHIDLSHRLCLDDKLLIINFYKSHNYTLKSIVKNLYFENGIYPDDKKINSSVRKITRWIKNFRSGGKKALIDKSGASQGFRKIDEEILIYAIVHCKALANHQGFYRVWDFYCWKIANRDGLHEATNEIIISYSAMVAAIKKMIDKNHKLFVWDKKGHDGLLQDYVVGVRDIAYTNQEWQVDATKFDFMCVMPDETIKRVNFSIVIDSFSGGVVGELSESINSYDQIRVLHKAITKMGLPEIVLSDNGKDYKSNHYQEVLLRNGITQVFARVGQGRGKGKVERFFGTFQNYISLVPGYIGSSVAYRVIIEGKNASKIAVRTSKATKFDISRLLKFDELNNLCNNILQNKYSNNYKAYDEFRLSKARLDQIKSNLGKSYHRKLQSDGVMINNITYQSSDIWINGLETGDKIEVREDIDNINQVFIYKDDKFIAIGINREMGVDCMSVEGHKKAVKSQKDNYLKPFMKIVKDTDDIRKYQDEFIEVNGIKAKYEDMTKPKEHLISISSINKSSPMIEDDMDELMKIAGY